jgi:hypothetical protein
MPTRLHVASGEGLFEGALFPHLQIVLDSTGASDAFLSLAAAKVDVIDGGRKVNRGWYLDGHLSLDQAYPGTVHLPIPATGIIRSWCSIWRSDSDSDTPAQVHATDGTCDVTLAPGKISGTATVTPSSMSASFDGELLTYCMVPGSLLDKGQPALPDVQICDSQFETDFCKPYRVWAQ